MFIAKAILVVAMLLSTFVVGSIGILVSGGMLSPAFIVCLIPYVFMLLMLLIEGI